MRNFECQYLIVLSNKLLANQTIVRNCLTIFILWEDEINI